jgi:hypothetical protein
MQNKRFAVFVIFCECLEQKRYGELVKLYEGYPVNDIRDQRNKVILGLLIFQALTIEELETLEADHINLKRRKDQGHRHRPDK